MSTPTAITASDLITDALRAINVIRETQAPSAEQQALAIRVLNQLMALWEADGKRLNYIPVGTVTALLTVPDGAILGMQFSLAIALCPYFGASASQEVIASASAGMAVIDKLTAKEPCMQMDIPVPSDWLQPRSIESG